MPEFITKFSTHVKSAILLSHAIMVQFFETFCLMGTNNLTLYNVKLAMEALHTQSEVSLSGVYNLQDTFFFIKMSLILTHINVGFTYTHHSYDRGTCNYTI